MKYQVIGISRFTRARAEFDVEAASIEEAREWAQGHGFDVESLQPVVLLDPLGLTAARLDAPQNTKRQERLDAPQNTKRQERLTVRDYEIVIDEGELTVNGPHEGLARLIGERFVALLKTDEGQLALASKEAQARVADLFDLPSKPCAELATAAQIRYARALGFDVSASATADELAFHLGTFEKVRFYVYFVFRSVFGGPPSELGVDSDTINEATAKILGDGGLAARILAIQFRRDVSGREAPRRGEAFREVRKIVREMKATEQDT